MGEPSIPLTTLSEAQRSQALERFAVLRPTLEKEKIALAQRMSADKSTSIQDILFNAWDLPIDIISLRQREHLIKIIIEFPPL